MVSPDLRNLDADVSILPAKDYDDYNGLYNVWAEFFEVGY